MKLLQLFLERFINLTLALILVMFFSPIIIAVILFIWKEEGIKSNIIYKQKRIGLKGKSFYIYKIRSMCSNSNNKLTSLNDKRITRVGKFIRKHRIDEIPQLFNVIKGDMNIIGPRPEQPKLVNLFVESVPLYNKRHSIKPGITGLAQIRHCYCVSDLDHIIKLKYDLIYISKRNILLDIKILIETVKVVITGKGAR